MGKYYLLRYGRNNRNNINILKKTLKRLRNLLSKPRLSSNYYFGITVEDGTKAAFGVNHVTGHIKAYAAESFGPVGRKKVRAVRGGDYGIKDFHGAGAVRFDTKEEGGLLSEGGELLQFRSPGLRLQINILICKSL